MAKLKSMGLFHTPQDVEELMNYVTALPDSDRNAAMVVMGMTWNLCARLTNERAAAQPDNDFCPTCREHTEFEMVSVCCGSAPTEAP